MQVLILDIKSMQEVYRYRLKVAKNDQGPAEKDLFVLAWRCALSDGAVVENDQGRYLLSSKKRD